MEGEEQGHPGQPIFFSAQCLSTVTYIAYAFNEE